MAPNQFSRIPKNVKFRLGLSATIQRFSQIQTKNIVQYFTKGSLNPFYYGIEENRQGLIYNCSDTVVRQPYDVIDMARVIQDKNSLFYYIKDLIKKDKERRGIK